MVLAAASTGAQARLKQRLYTFGDAAISTPRLLR